MSQKKSARIFLILIIGLLLVNSVFALRDDNNDGYNDDYPYEYLGIGPANNPASEASAAVNQIIQVAFEILRPLAELLVGPSSDSKMFFAKVLLSFILFGFVYTVIDRANFLDNGFLKFMIAVLVPILGIRFLEEGWVKAILLPYSTFAIAAGVLVPLSIYFMIVEQNNSKTFRKIAWIFAIFVLIGLYFTRVSELALSAAIIYPLAALACVFFMIFDKSIRNMWEGYKNENLMSISQIKKKAHIIEMNDKADEDYLNNRINLTEYRRLKRSLHHQGIPFGINISVP